MIAFLSPPIFALLDVIFFFRRMPMRWAFANLTGLFLLAFMFLGMIGMWQFRGITSDVQTISKDVLISLGATRELRTSLYEFRLRLLRDGLAGEKPGSQEIQVFEERVHQYFTEYQNGVFTDRGDREYLDRLEIAEAKFVSQLHAHDDGKDDGATPADRALTLDRAAEPLATLLYDAGSLNSKRLKTLSAQTFDRATSGLSSSYLIWIALICIGVTGLALIFLNRWLDEMEQ